MKKILFIFACMSCLPMWGVDATMYQWKSHFAYGEMTQVLDGTDQVFGLASGALFSVEKSNDRIQIYNKNTGLSGGDIAQIAYDKTSRTLIIAYADGLIDLMHNGTIYTLTDLRQKSITASKKTNQIVVDNGFAYLCMPFGILVIDVQRRLIKDTYYIGANGSDVNVLDLSIGTDSIFAISSQSIYSAKRTDNLMDYNYWHNNGQLTGGKAYKAICIFNNEPFTLINTTLYHRQGGLWCEVLPEKSIQKLRMCDQRLFLIMDEKGIHQLDANLSLVTIASPYTAIDIAVTGTTYWLGTSKKGIVRQTKEGTQEFIVDGPVVNQPYRLHIANNRLYMLAGQRWADENPTRDANIMIYDIQKDSWQNILAEKVDSVCQYHVFDLMNVAVDPQDPEHFYVTTYGTGVLECRGTEAIHLFTSSPLESAAGNDIPNYFRTDGAIFDSNGNLWFLNAGVKNLVHVANPSQLAQATKTGKPNWYKMPLQYNDQTSILVHTPDIIYIDNQNPNWKWIISKRSTTGLILLDDNGTPQYSGDDVAYFRNTFEDQDGNAINPQYIYSFAQDNDGTLWIGLENGLITIPTSIDYRTSNKCERIKIARNDGTGLADYLLETERVNAIAIDGANRKWFGTQASGVFLISANGEETVSQFTEDNSPLLSNDILSIAIDPLTGKVFIGTSKGLMSYQGDAAMPFDDYSSAYAYPNPVYPNYEGVITITGLMDESIVHITDNAGNLVCETRSNGGTAIWDGRTANGKRVASGIYNVFSNEGNGQHTLVKILVMH